MGVLTSGYVLNGSLDRPLGVSAWPICYKITTLHRTLLLTVIGGVRHPPIHVEAFSTITVSRGAKWTLNLAVGGSESWAGRRYVF